MPPLTLGALVGLPAVLFASRWVFLTLKDNPRTKAAGKLTLLWAIFCNHVHADISRIRSFGGSRATQGHDDRFAQNLLKWARKAADNLIANDEGLASVLKDIDSQAHEIDLALSKTALCQSIADPYALANVHEADLIKTSEQLIVDTISIGACLQAREQYQIDEIKMLAARIDHAASQAPKPSERKHLLSLVDLYQSKLFNLHMALSADRHRLTQKADSLRQPIMCKIVRSMPRKLQAYIQDGSQPPWAQTQK